MSLSRISPVSRLLVVVVDAITPLPVSGVRRKCRPSSRRGSRSPLRATDVAGGTNVAAGARAEEHEVVVEAGLEVPILRSVGAVESGSSVSTRSVHWTAAQVWKLLRIAPYVSAVGRVRSALRVDLEGVRPRLPPEAHFPRCSWCAPRRAPAARRRAGPKRRASPPGAPQHACAQLIEREVVGFIGFAAFADQTAPIAQGSLSPARRGRPRRTSPAPAARRRTPTEPEG